MPSSRPACITVGKQHDCMHVHIDAAIQDTMIQLHVDRLRLSTSRPRSPPALVSTRAPQRDNIGPSRISSSVLAIPVSGTPVLALSFQLDVGPQLVPPFPNLDCGIVHDRSFRVESPSILQHQVDVCIQRLEGHAIFSPLYSLFDCPQIASVFPPHTVMIRHISCTLK